MQFDKTRIAIRERTTLEVLDLALHVLRTNAWPWLAWHLVAIVPLALLNHFLVGWMLDLAYFRESYSQDDLGAIVRYLWSLGMLTYVEAPLASLFFTMYLGQAIFEDRPSWRTVLRDVGRLTPRWAWCHLVLRCVAVYWLILFQLDRQSEVVEPFEVLSCVVLLVAGGAVRAVRPFLNEVVLLERNPLFGKRGEMTIGRRMRLLHEPTYGELFGQWLVASFVCLSLAAALFGTLWFCRAMVDNEWWPTPLTFRVLYPMSLWIVAGYATVVRFLQYLDIRIRQEGWEVDLRLRAEAARLQQGIVS